jgi:hypothetical protein
MNSDSNWIKWIILEVFSLILKRIMELQRVVQLLCTGFSEEPPAFVIKVGTEAGGFFEPSAHIYQNTLCYLHFSGTLCNVDW